MSTSADFFAFNSKVWTIFEVARAVICWYAQKSECVVDRSVDAGVDRGYVSAKIA